MDMQELIAFERVARERSISAAAASLNLSQPTVTARIQTLEHKLERPLFTRTHRGVELTRAGEVLLPYVERALRILKEGREAVRVEGSPIRRLTLGATAANGAYLLPPILRAFVAKGNVDVEVHTGHSHQVLEMLLDDSIQAGFVISAPVRAGIKQIRVYKGPILCVASPNHPLKGRPSVRLADFEKESIALVNWGPDFDRFSSALHEATGHPPHGLVKVSPVEAAKTLAATGDVYTFLPELVVTQELARGELVVIEVEDMPKIDWELHLLYRDRKILNDTLIDFLTHVPIV